MHEDGEARDLGLARPVVVDPAGPGTALDNDGDRGEGAADGIEGGFGAQVVVDEGPACAGVDVVELKSPS